MNYAFVLDNRRCIGCHACSVACQVEHQTPLGLARTWVKSIEKGAFPDTRRHFQVTRCNHCAGAPCVEICPTSALFTRHDGIVDLDPRRCTGCRGCLQACPYDALDIDPRDATAAKCNFCAHRVEAGREPPCVTVCPTQAIVAGDLDLPGSRLVQLLGRHAVQVRKPEKGTRPRLFYIDGDAALLDPAAAPPAGAYLFAEAPQPAMFPTSQPEGEVGAPRRGHGGREPHRQSWGLRVTLGLWTKTLAAGAFLVPVLASHGTPAARRLPLGPALTAWLFVALAAVSLAGALGQPRRALWILTHPRWSSWLVKGAYLLLFYEVLLSVQVLAAGLRRPLPGAALLVFLTLLAAAATAVSTAFLFGQAKGRDLWQSPLVAPHRLVQALAAGAALAEPRWLLGLLPVNGLMIAAEVFGAHPTADGDRAARIIQDDPFFTSGVLALGHLVPLTLLWSFPAYAWLASLLALVGLLVWEYLFVQAPQQVPLA